MYQPGHHAESRARPVRIQTQHFDLSTDLSPEDARRAAEALERNRAAILSAAWGRGVDGRITSRSLVVVLPWNALILDTYAATLFAVGRCPDALNMQKRAADLAPEWADHESVLVITAKVAEYSSVCGAQAAAPEPPPAP